VFGPVRQEPNACRPVRDVGEWGLHVDIVRLLGGLVSVSNKWSKYVPSPMHPIIRSPAIPCLLHCTAKRRIHAPTTRHPA